jgi:serine phosphatase RsbU (regulator of sigma subunit)
MQNRLELTLDIVDVNYQLGEYENNLVLLDEIKSIAKALDDKASLARILFLLGRNNSFLGHNNTALDYYKEALPVAEEISGINLQALIYASIGRVHIYEAVYDKAIEYIKKSLELFSKEESMEKLYALGMLGQSYSYLGYKTEALATVDELTAYKYTDNNMMKVWSSFYIAAILSFIGDPDKAILECKNAYELSKEAKILVLELNCLLLFGRAHFYRSSFSEAIKYLIRYINVSKQHHIVFMIFLGYYFIIECFILIGDINSARKYLKEVLEEKYTKELNSDYINQWSTRLEALFEVFSHSPDLKKANCLADKAIDISKSLGNKYKYHTCYNYMVKYLVLLEADKEAEGMEYYEKALSYFTDNDLQNIVKLSKKMRSKILSKKGIIEENDEIDTSVFSTSSFLTSSSSSEMSYQRQLKYLLRLSEQLSSFHEMDILLQKIMDFSIEASGAERGALFLYEDGEGGACVSLKIMTGIENNAGKDFEYSKKMLDKTFETKKGQLVIDAGIELSADDNYGDTNLKSIMTVPLMTKGKLLGAIYLDNKQVKGLFNEQNFELLKAFAVEAAISIENAKLYKQVEENARIEQEMAIAKDIQISILPDINDIKGYKIAGYMRTADEVGGDYYDFYLNESPYLGVFGDVSGHGLKSGLIMMMAEVSFNTIARIESMKNSALKNIYQTINNTLYENIQSRLSKKSFIGSQYSNMYMTFRLYRFNEEGDFEMFGNDHAEPFICRKKTGEIIPIPSTGFIIGIVGDALGGDDASFKFKLDEGDLLCLYSDGISEAKKAGSENTNGSLDLFSDERLHNLVSMNRNKSPQEIISQVTHEVENWMSIQHDDISIVVIKKE